MEKVGCSTGVIEHVVKVTDLALKITEKFTQEGYQVDKELIIAGGILHDIGRSETHGVEHGVVGGQIAKKLGLPNKLVKLIERHVGAGIPFDEAEILGFPSGEYEPDTLEEKIITYADKLVEGKDVADIEEIISKFEKELGKNHPAIKRLKALHEEITNRIGSITRNNI
jgi:uncharacterized protein